MLVSNKLLPLYDHSDVGYNIVGPYDGVTDIFQILVVESLCWWLVKVKIGYQTFQNGFYHLKLVTNINSTSVININIDLLCFNITILKG